MYDDKITSTIPTYAFLYGEYNSARKLFCPGSFSPRVFRYITSGLSQR